MSVLLCCDAPDCFKTTPAIARAGRPAAPDGWWIQATTDNAFIVACCDEHLVAISKGKQR